MALISDKVNKLVQLRIKNEQQSSRIYAAMGSWLAIKGYDGASKLWNKYSKEELLHVDWAKEYLLDLNILPIEPSQEQPQTEFKGLPQIIALSYKHELQITEECKELAKTALEEGDMMTFNLAQKYIKEQQDEIAKTQAHLDYLEAFGDSQISLQLLDQKMGGM